MAKDLKLFKKKEPRSLLEADEANKLINAIKALQKLSVVPQEVGSFSVSDSGCVLDLSQLVAKITSLSSTDTSSGNGAATSDQPSTGNSGGTTTNASYDSRITALENRIASASISAVCNSDGTITVTLKI